MRFFQLFSKTTLTILIIFGQNVEENDTDQQKKTARQKLAPFSRYSSIKLAFLVDQNFFDQKNFFFRLTILNGPIREKNMFPEIRNFFALMT